MQRRELEFQEKVLALDSRRDSHIIAATTIFVTSFLTVATFSFLIAVDLIKTVVAVVSAGLGGYGVANRRGKQEKQED